MDEYENSTWFPTTTSEDYIGSGFMTNNPTTQNYDTSGILSALGQQESQQNAMANAVTQALGSGSASQDILKALFGQGKNVVSGLLGKGSTGLGSYVGNNAGALTGLLALALGSGMNKPQAAGYTGGIPRYTATRERVAQPAGRRPGGPAGRYFTDVQYRAHGGYLDGATDGMADRLPANIDGKQPAKLSHGEFVVPADVVSHLGNGNSTAGAKKLYEMMDRVRQARTGKKSQAPEMNADKMMPKYAGGGIVAFADGGLTGATGGLETTAGVGPQSQSATSTLAPWIGPYVTDMLGKAQALSNMPYQGYEGALTAGASPLQEQAFAGIGSLQTPAGLGQAQQATQQITGQLQGMNYTPGQFTTGTFGTQQAQQYMNPYLSAALEPQLAEARRQAEISRVQQAGRLTKAGAYGGSRQAIMESELQRNLARSLADITGQGYGQAYKSAQEQFNAEQNRALEAQRLGESSRQFGTTAQQQALQTALSGAGQMGTLAQRQQESGLANLKAQMEAGQLQRDIEGQGLAADYRRFQEERDYPLKMAQFQQSFLQGLPITSTTYGQDQSPLQQLAGSGLGLLGIYQALAGLGQTQSSGSTTPVNPLI